MIEEQLVQYLLNLTVGKTSESMTSTVEKETPVVITNEMKQLKKR